MQAVTVNPKGFAPAQTIPTLYLLQTVLKKAEGTHVHTYVCHQPEIDNIGSFGGREESPAALGGCYYI